MDKNTEPNMEQTDTQIDFWTGIPLTPSEHGTMCLGNGEQPGLECCCDECDYYLLCFPDWRSFLV